ncbi:MAG: rhodanese-like domain-containing protein [Methanothrix sp.]
MAIFGGAEGGCSCRGGGGDAWSGASWLQDALGGPSSLAAEASAAEAGVENVYEEPIIPEEPIVVEADELSSEDLSSWSISAEELRTRLDRGTKPVVAYVSNIPPDGSYIAGSIKLPSKSLITGDGSLRSAEDMAAVLGRAGVTEEDGLVLYGDCFSCGDMTFVFWIMKYLGHRDVSVLRDSQEEWSAAGLSLSGATSTMDEAVYTPDPRLDLMADYEAVSAGVYQVVDARTPDQFNQGHIPGAVNIDYHQVMEGSWLKSDSDLAEIFADLQEDKPVAVYTKNGGAASIVWYALKLQGHDARLYTWNDWLSHRG